MRNVIRPLVVVFALLVTAGVGPARPVTAAPQAAPFVVNWLLDEPDLSLVDGICLSTPLGKCTLRAAVQQANFNAGPDSIVLGVGTYSLSLPGLDDTSVTGDLDLLTDLTIIGAGSAQTHIQMTVADRVLQVAVSQTIQLTGLEITGGATNSQPGAGIYNAGTLTLVDANVHANNANNASGGGIYNSGVLTLTHSFVSHNGAGHDGGGIYNYAASRLTLLDSELHENNAQNAEGGGLFNVGLATLIRSRVTHNTSAQGGGGINNTWLLRLTDTTVEQNTASVRGGGLYNYGYGQAQIDTSTFYSNTAGSGGGIYNSNVLTLTKSTVVQNVTSADGGGLLNAGQAWIEASTIALNTAEEGGGLFNLGANLFLIETTLSGNYSEDGGAAIFNGSNGTINGYNLTVADNQSNTSDTPTSPLGAVIGASNLNLRNSLLTRNFYTVAAVHYPQDCTGTLNRYGIVYFENPGAGCTLGGPGSSFISAFTTLIGPLANNGGPTRTHALLPGNPAIDGTNAVDGYGCVNPSYLPLTSDQRGLPRIFGVRCDAGAYEFGFWVFAPLVQR